MLHTRKFQILQTVLMAAVLLGLTACGNKGPAPVAGNPYGYPGGPGGACPPAPMPPGATSPLTNPAAPAQSMLNSMGGMGGFGGMGGMGGYPGGGGYGGYPGGGYPGGGYPGQGGGMAIDSMTLNVGTSGYGSGNLAAAAYIYWGDLQVRFGQSANPCVLVQTLSPNGYLQGGSPQQGAGITVTMQGQVLAPAQYGYGSSGPVPQTVTVQLQGGLNPGFSRYQGQVIMNAPSLGMYSSYNAQ